MLPYHDANDYNILCRNVNNKHYHVATWFVLARIPTFVVHQCIQLKTNERAKQKSYKAKTWMFLKAFFKSNQKQKPFKLHMYTNIYKGLKV